MSVASAGHGLIVGTDGLIAGAGNGSVIGAGDGLIVGY